MIIRTLTNVFKVPELRNKVLFTLGMLAVFRVGHWIPLPGINQEQIKEHFDSSRTQGSAFGQLADFVSMFSGGALSHSTIFGLGIMPYISAGIIFQLLSSTSPALKKLQEEGPTGRQKIMEWTRYATLALCLIQGIGWLSYIGNMGLVYPEYYQNPLWWVMGVAALTAGCMFLMWLGEQIDKHGIGNGVSMIIMAGILTQFPNAVLWLVRNSPMADLLIFKTWLTNDLEPGWEPTTSWMGVILIGLGFLIVVGGSVLMTVAQRRIPIQQAKHTRGRRVFGGQRSYLPLKINHGGVMPIVFASSLMIFPSVAFTGCAEAARTGGWMLEGPMHWLAQNFGNGEFLYSMLFILMIYFFSYFWINVQFNPEEMSKQLRDHGSFIPGLRPGPRTAEYLETVMVRVTYVGAGFLALIAILPMIVQKAMNIPFHVSQFLGGTGLLIVVSVCLDFLQRVEANLLMRNYAGFLAGDDDTSGPRLKGPRGG
jgi:preprotein translocase subunit SecY